ncbi:MAG: chorismate synthase [Acutalibacteraceae bacterium]|nr:chorismate synthase [Acutalibacteraceae bacterium]
MKNVFGNNITLTLFGESHGQAIGAVLDGIAPGVQVDEEFIRHQLSLRRPSGDISTSRSEADLFSIKSGVVGGKTTGTPICIIIENENKISRDYSDIDGKARPGHADYAAFCKYHGFEDRRGGGHFSGRITAALVAACAIVTYALKQKGILIGTHIRECAGVADRAFDNLKEDISIINEKVFAVFSDEQGKKMQENILKAKESLDSVGGILQTAVIGMPAGVGEPWFDTVESVLAHGLFSIPAVKGVEFGSGFAFADMKGSEANDCFKIENGQAVTLTNNNGGINGGITNGMPIVFSCAVKPTPSIAKEQQTVDFVKNEDVSLKINGRHDPCIVHRARVVVDSITALVLADFLTGRYGTDWLRS